MNELLGAGEKLPGSLRERIVAEGQRLVPALVEVLLDEEDDDIGGWASIHAVDLLVDLKAEAAIGPMLRILAEMDWDFIIFDRIVLRLPELGAPVLEPALALLAEAPPGPFPESLCAILSNLGVRDERVFEELRTRFALNPDMGCGWLGDYGDERARPLLEQEIENTVPDADSGFGLHPLVDLVEAYERVAGTLPDSLRTLVNDRRTLWEAKRAARRPQPPTAGAVKIGRNAPCPCGSGKKYKRCHLITETTSREPPRT
jgi:hypothetical protein